MNKDWYKSKTVLAALGVLLLAVFSALGLPVPAEAFAALGAGGLYGLRDAMN